MYGQRKATAWAGRLLLFAALLFGIVTMHTLGHPSENGSDHMRQAVAVGTAAHHPAGGETYMAPGTPHLPSTHDPAQNSGMDPMSACLAVLVVWSVALLAAGILSRRPVAPQAAARARQLLALWPNPPPRGTLLAQLSVLRQ